MRWLAPSLSIGLLLLSAPASAGGKKPAARAPHLCKAAEQVFFACRIKGKAGKLVSLCGSRDLAEKDGRLVGRLEYRFGKPGKPELTFPAPGADLRKAFEYSRYTRPMFSLVHFGFVNKGFRYTLFAELDAEGDPDAKAANGVRVGKAEEGAKTTDLPCVGPVTDRLMELEDLGWKEAP